MQGAREKPNLELTTMQLDILQFHKTYSERYGQAPGLRTIARHLDVYPNTVRWHLQRLRERGLIREKEPRPVTGKFVLSTKGRRAAG